MQRESLRQLYARRALTAKGWQRDVRVSVNAQGRITEMQAGIAAPGKAFDLLLPGLADVHSHSFQRAMGGLTEIASGKDKDNFWSWREVMYRFAETLDPDFIEAISRVLYIELLKQGYTAVGEFHYLHHDASGKPYASRSETSDRVIAAAKDTGIHLTHLPVLYETGNFGGVAAHPRQKRFLHRLEDYLKLLETLQSHYGASEDFVLGVAPHSLRAVPAESLEGLLAALPELKLGACPIHIHISEQEKEVADCLAATKERPVQWLFKHAPVDKRWCLIHATHMNVEETQTLARSQAVVGLCPTSEANLGDGIFPGEAFLKAGGKFAIGTDSHIGISPFEELRMLEYSQRLALRKRAVLHEEATPSVGRTLFDKVREGGAQAMGIASGSIEKGFRADLIALSTNEYLFQGKEDDQLLDTLIFAARPQVTDVFVGGKHVITNGRHSQEEKSFEFMRKLLRRVA